MGSFRKVALHGTAVFVTTSVEEGFVFPANPLIMELLKKSAAQALALHPLDICAMLAESTHVHFILVLDDPDTLRGFMERFKTESAHAVNNLLGRDKHTIWCEGYDSPTLLDLEKAIDKLAYLYENPSKDGLADSVDRYQHLSTWKMFLSGHSTVHTYHLPRPAFRKLPESAHCYEGYKREHRLLVRRHDKRTFEVNHTAWMEVFGVTDRAEQQAVKERVIAEVRRREALHRAYREELGRNVIDARRQRETRIGAPYQPKRSGRRTWCLGSYREQRKAFIAKIKRRVKEAERVWKEWKNGNTAEPFPIGLYPPSLPKRGNVYPVSLHSEGY